MDNYLSKTFTILLLVVLLCVVPAFYITMLTDFTKTVNVTSETRSLLDRILLTGEVNENDFINNKDLDIEVYRDVYFENEEGNYELKTICYTKDSLVKNKNVSLEVGDKIVLTNKCSFVKTSLFMKSIFGTSCDDIFIRLAGICKNESN